MDNIGDEDLYELIGADKEATTAEIKKAYRKKALTCHPDKQPDNPRAAELFHQLTHALEILTDTAARAAYDKVLNARHRAKERVKELDAKRKKLKEDLEAREDAYKKSLSSSYKSTSDQDRFQAEVERLRKEGSKQVEEEVALVTERIKAELRARHGKNIQSDTGPYRIKIKWKIDKTTPVESKSIYDYDSLLRIFSKYGNVEALVVSPEKKCRAIIEYSKKQDAEMALKTEVGFSQLPLTLEKLWTDEQESTAGTKFQETMGGFQTQSNMKPEYQKSTTATSSIDEQQGKMSDADFERLVLSNLRRAEERKRRQE